MKIIRIIQIAFLLAGVVFIVLSITIDRDDTLFLSLGLGFTIVANIITLITNTSVIKHKSHQK